MQVHGEPYPFRALHGARGNPRSEYPPRLRNGFSQEGQIHGCGHFHHYRGKGRLGAAESLCGKAGWVDFSCIYYPDFRGNDTQKTGHMFVYHFRRYSLIILHFGTNMCTTEQGRTTPFPKFTGQKGNANENRRTGYHQGCRPQCTGGGEVPWRVGEEGRAGRYIKKIKRGILLFSD